MFSTAPCVAANAVLILGKILRIIGIVSALTLCALAVINRNKRLSYIGIAVLFIVSVVWISAYYLLPMAGSCFLPVQYVQ
jgi:hypothetical protein